jgi:hypothetical protein
MVVSLCRAILASGAASALFVGHRDFTWPYVTVSDVLATSGGPVLYASWAAAFAVYCSVRCVRGTFPALAAVGLLAPAFGVPYGTPIRIEHAMLAPRAYAAHVSWALAYVALAATIAETRATVISLAAATSALYVGGQLADAPVAVALGCFAEWALLYSVAFYAM